jgi:endonuclease VIII-like 1
MGMSGNWKFVQTDKWNETKFVRMRMDTTDGWSLLLYGGYMGPKYKLGGFTGVKRGPDPLKENDKFKKGVLDNIGCKEFDKPLGESLLNQKYFNGIGAYLLAEIVGRLDYNPHRTINQLCNKELEDLFNMIVRCFEESYSFGGGEIKDWQNPFGENRIDEWLMFYNNKEICYKQKFGTRNIWIHKKWKTT